jgi:LmbE family N-acetylglucosaminyl deacetylase
MKSNASIKFREFLDTQFNLRNKIRGLNFKIISKVVLSWLSKPETITYKAAVIFAPHQDDETLGCGGMIALKRKYGIPVSVVFVTDGKQSHGQERNISPSELIETRREEALEALSILGVDSSEIYFLEQPDGFLHYQTNQDHQALVDKFIEVLKKLKPGEIYVPHRKDQHIDHEITYQLVSSAIKKSGIKAEVLQYPVWLFWQSLIHWKLEFNHLSGARKISISPVQKRKKDAIKVYCSQHSILPLEFIENFLGRHEIFFKP